MPNADFIEVLQQVTGILVDAVGARLLEFLATVAAGQQADAERGCSLCRQQIPDAVAHDDRVDDIDTESFGGGQEEIGIRLRMRDVRPRDYDLRLHAEYRNGRSSGLRTTAGGDRPGNALLGQAAE